MKTYLIGIAAGLFLAAPAWAGEIQYDISLEGITCPFCVATSERALGKIDGVRRVSGNLETGVIRVCADETVRFTEDQLSKLFLKKGFTFAGMAVSESCEDFESSTVLSDEEMAALKEKHPTLGHGDDDETSDWHHEDEDHDHEGHDHEGHDHDNHDHEGDDHDHEGSAL